jgi:hypothetical protein
MKTVGVAPGTFTIQLGDCPPVDVNVFTPPLHAGPRVRLDPYGTQSMLKGTSYTPIQKTALVVVGGVLGYAALYALTSARRRRRRIRL